MTSSVITSHSATTCVFTCQPARRVVVDLLIIGCVRLRGMRAPFVRRSIRVNNSETQHCTEGRLTAFLVRYFCNLSNIGDRVRDISWQTLTNTRPPRFDGVAEILSAAFSRHDFYRRDAMLVRLLAMVACLSVAVTSR